MSEEASLEIMSSIMNSVNSGHRRRRELKIAGHTVDPLSQITVVLRPSRAIQTLPRLTK